jgi:hypothetical protein
VLIGEAKGDKGSIFFAALPKRRELSIAILYLRKMLFDQRLQAFSWAPIITNDYTEARI